jgi:serine/threonine-protein kinase
MTEKGAQKLGRYRLLALLATGGMAEIYLAQQSGIEGFERLVVVKKILPHLARDAGFLEMFFDEARIAARLNHPNIVQIFDLGQDGDDYFIAMEYLEGESLAYLEHQARKTEKVMNTSLAAGVIAQVCDGLEYAHTFLGPEGEPLNIVHRDVSPQNIIILFTGGVKLVDFGIAKATTQMHETRVGTMKGKLSYMSREHVLGKSVDRRSDVFSLGIILWELLSRRRLFKRPSEPATIQAVMDVDVPSIREIQAHVPEELEAVALRALHEDPDKRFQSAGAMGKALRDYLLEIGAAAGTREIADFVDRVFSERARTKRRLLDKLGYANGEISDVSVLKAETSESMPSRSHLEDIPTPTDRSVQARAVKKETTPPPEEEPLPIEEPRELPEAPARAVYVPTPPRRMRAAIWAGLFGLAIGICLVTAWLLWGGTADKKEDAKASAATDETNTAATGPEKPKVVWLNIFSGPAGCKIKLDGIELPGVTPIEGVAIEPEKPHKVVVLCQGFDTNYQRERPHSGLWISSAGHRAVERSLPREAQSGRHPDSEGQAAAGKAQAHGHQSEERDQEDHPGENPAGQNHQDGQETRLVDLLRSRLSFRRFALQQ